MKAENKLEKLVNTWHGSIWNMYMIYTCQLATINKRVDGFEKLNINDVQTNVVCESCAREYRFFYRLRFFKYVAFQIWIWIGNQFQLEKPLKIFLEQQLRSNTMTTTNITIICLIWKEVSNRGNLQCFLAKDIANIYRK